MSTFIPVRTCIGCGKKCGKKELIRIVHSTDGTVTVDPEQKRNGRGVYLCRQLSCLEKAKRRRSLERGLKIPADPGMWEVLKKEMESIAAG